MRYAEHDPSPAARSLLACLWELETDGRDVQRIVPDGRSELIFNLAAPFESFREDEWRLQPRCFLAGQLTGPLLIRPSGPAHILAARFHPQGASRVFDFDMASAVDMVVPLELAASTLAELEAVLLARVRPADPIVDEYLATGAVPAVSARTLERRFKRAVGLAPKLYARIQRFQRVFHELESGGNWVETAIACGYYDQAHLVRDMREFSGETPSALVNGDELARHFLSHFSKTEPPLVP
jgi:AraC-like DNA-binding protein